jgi:C_GCAxxG_C_C family probable redox protein
MNKKEDPASAAVACFKEGFCCSQAVFSIYAEQWGLDRDIAMKISDAFGAGMAIGHTCGAVTGAVMAVGLKYGRTKADDDMTKEKMRSLTREFVGKFIDRNDSIECKQLLGYDITIPEEMAAADEKGLFNTLCPKFIEDAVNILNPML